jgi:putative oxidoreductase
MKNSRRLGHVLVIAGLIAVVASVVWWEASYDAAMRALGRNLKISHPMDCLLLFTGPCAQDKAAVLSGMWPAYNPAALWLSFALVIAGLVVVYRSAPLGPYPVTPPGEPRLFIGKLEPFYAWVRDLGWPIVRIAVGGDILTHGVRKLLEGTIAAFAVSSMERRGIHFSIAYLIYFNETVAAVLLAFGLFTRFIAAVLAIEFAVVTYTVFPNGYVISNPGGGWGYPLLMGVLCFAIALRGGGPYSLDRALGREL